MYTAQELVERIKEQAKMQDELIKDVLAACDLNVNSLSQMTDKKGLSSFSLAKIADYLNCSTDYLLGRTAAPETTAPFLPQKEQQLLAAYKAHPELQFAVDKLLGINDEDTETVKIVARSEDDAPMTTEKVPKSKVKAALEDKSIQSDEYL